MGFMTPWSEGSKSVGLRDDVQTLCTAGVPDSEATVGISRLTIALPYLADTR